MDLLRAAFLLESEMADLSGFPAWKRRELENITAGSVRAMRAAAERLAVLEATAESPNVARLPRR